MWLKGWAASKESLWGRRPIPSRESTGSRKIGHARTRIDLDSDQRWAFSEVEETVDVLERLRSRTEGFRSRLRRWLGYCVGSWSLGVAIHASSNRRSQRA